MGNWCKINVLKMEAAAIGAATVDLFSSIINDMQLRVHRQKSHKCCHVLLGLDDW